MLKDYLSKNDLTSLKLQTNSTSFIQSSIHISKQQNAGLVGLCKFVTSIGFVVSRHICIHSFAGDVGWIGLEDLEVEGQYIFYGSQRPMTYSNWSPYDPNDSAVVSECSNFNTHSYFSPQQRLKKMK